MRFETSRTEQEIFDELEQLCASPGYIHVLAVMSLRDNLVTFAGEMTAEALTTSYAPERTVRTEYSTLIGLMIKHPIDFTWPDPKETQRLLDRTRALLGELHASFNQPMLAAVQKAFMEAKAGIPPEQASPFLTGAVLREPIFYGGESAYSFQYREFALARYRPDDSWLEANKGFRIAEACAVAEALSSLANRKLREVITGFRKLSSAEWSILPGFTFSRDEIAVAAEVAPAVADAVLAAFTVPDGPVNQGFGATGDFNLANAMPILRDPDGHYVALQSYGLVEALYDSPFYWMAADPDYKDQAARHRGAFTETIAAERLSAVFGSANVHRGVDITAKGRRVGEIDVLVLFGDRAIVVQCKSKKLTLAARKGNDLQLRGDFEKAVQDAFDQAHLCAEALRDGNFTCTSAAGEILTIPALREIYPLCIVSDHYPALAAQVRRFLKARSDAVIQPPLVGDIFLIDVLAEMLASPLRLLSYINRRVGCGDRLGPVSELSVLGYHLQNNLWLDDDTGMVALDENFSLALDTAMTVRRMGVPGSPTVKGILTILEGTTLGRLIAHIEHRPDGPLIDLGFLLLSLDQDTLRNLNRGLGELAAKTRADGETHDLTLGFDNGEGGLTVHCSPAPRAQAFARLQDHCRRRKYVHRAPNWFGLAIRPLDGRPEFGVQLRFPWKRDDKLEVLTEGMAVITPARPRKGSAGMAPRATAKTGRNEPCPCGSGAKYKKCCLPRS